jgi:DNA-binding SARP family transcriptional activator
MKSIRAPITGERHKIATDTSRKGIGRLSLLGGFELRNASGKLTRLPTRKAEALLAFLALAPRRAQPRDSLTALLWGDAPEKHARASLRQTLSLIGKALGRGALVADARSVALGPGALETDVAEFDGGAATGDATALERACALYRGELLAGLAVSEPPFEEWLLAERERLRERAIDRLARLISAQRERGEIERAIDTGLRLLALEPLEEIAHRALMRLYAEQGRRAAALRQYQVCVSVLRRELGAEPAPETKSLYNELLRRPHPEPGERQGAEMPIRATPLIGRRVELDLVAAALVDARAGRGRVIAILGEAGIGKTRLTEEIAARAGEDGFGVLAGRCYESQQLFPFAPWVELFRAAGIPADAELLDGLEPAWRTEIARILPELAAGEEEPGDEGLALELRGRLFEAILRLVARLVTRGPMVLLLEDLHWADETSLRLLATVGRRIQDLPVALLVTARGEEISGAPHLRRTLQELEKDGRLAQLSLAPLSRGDTALLVRSLVRAGTDEGTTARVAELAWQASEGNPFVVVESVRAIGDEALRGTGAVLSLPERVRDLIRDHVERLGPGARKLLAVAAVAGRDFDFALLQRACGLSEHEASEALEELVRRQILCAVGEHFDFVHDRIRQVVDDDLLAPARRALHAAIAEALEALHARDLAKAYGLLAYHYARTDRSEKAVTYLTRFAERAAHGGAHAEAIIALDEALGHLARYPEAPGEQRRLDLVFRKARSLFFLGRFAEVLDLLLPERERVDAAGSERIAAAYYFRLGSTLTYLGDHARAVENAKRALAEATSCADGAMMGKAHFLLALASFWTNPAAGVRHGREAVKLLENTDERWWLGQACWVLGLNLAYAGRFAEGLAMEERARTLADGTGDRRLASYAAWTTGFIHTLVGDMNAAVSACRNSVELSIDPLNRMTSLGMLALAHVERREPGAAIPLLEEAIPQAARFQIPQLHGLFLAFRGEAALQAGDPDAALQMTAQGAGITRAAGYNYGLGWSQRVLGRIARASGDLSLARAHLEDAITTFRAMGAPFETGRTHLELGELLESAIVPVDARPHAQAALGALDSLGLQRFSARARALLTRLGALPAAAN